MVLKAMTNDRHTLASCHDEFRGPRSDAVEIKWRKKEQQQPFRNYLFREGFMYTVATSILKLRPNFLLGDPKHGNRKVTFPGCRVDGQAVPT
ncbi:hypothetical protein TNCV_909571 [Trichonephila clavipes]|nr:hypothetical protein TNCV_909571 [Trichonephila clavipes]